MGLFKKKQEEMELPPPPPPEEGDVLEFPEIPEEEAHIPSEMPDIKAEEPSFPYGQEEPFMKGMTGAPVEAPPEMEEMPQMEDERAAPSEAPYVDIANFQDVMTNVGMIRDALKESDSRISRLAEIKNIEEKELEKWRAQLEDIERKLSYIDEVIAKGE